ncbi:MAG: hypothetical protein WBL71_05455, partial [Bacillota bacterium]
DGKARHGDPILQPGVADGGVPDRDEIGYLERFIPVEMSGRVPPCVATRSIELAMNRWLKVSRSPVRVEVVARSLASSPNIVDAAVARPLSSKVVNPHILGLGEIRGVREPELGLRVRKSGRTTGVTEGEIRVIDATVSVIYSDDLTATFIDQILTSKMGDSGDSGSVGVDDEMNAVGLLFAGSNTFTIYNRMTNVLKMLEVSF